jgi:hypothetical protein
MFELGKGALTIESKQTKEIKIKSWEEYRLTYN